MTTTPVFLFGTLRDATLRRVVLGDDAPVVPAALPGWAVARVARGDWPVLAPAPEGRAAGLLAALGAEALARADWYEGLFGYAREAATVETAEGPRAAQVWRPVGCGAEALPPAGGARRAWDLADWQARHAPLARLAAEEAMALRGMRPADETARRWPVIRARAQARLNASDTPPTTLRRRAGPGDVAVAERRTPYAGFFAVEEYELRHARFAGGMSEPMTRAAFVSADAVTVLPYDPGRDRVMVIEQFRAGPFARGDAQPWSLEAIAGRIDPGETPEETARREAREEAGLEIGPLIPIGRYYPSPGAKSEFIHSYIGLAELPDSAAGLGGVAHEHEDIRAHVVPFDRLMALVETGEAGNAPLILSALALERRRAALRAG
ncbi:NUDIX domain-containing protein [Rhodovulum sp. 12E13]|uniref:NUDIX domain-containing protein n=1 Tax=Rhodovulum sp. 12E13 TaxID=2203891 RepID=UPI000E13FD59|nr:NUDIX domain-containing protein [Rhodovulum sp. 12E13]RDC73430.1 NUDIX domain-containing protein [Rhodovulum sp. 12E13]